MDALNSLSQVANKDENNSAFDEEIKTRQFPSAEEIREHSYDYLSGNPAVYCGTYAKYNNGSIEGMWIDLTTFCDYEDFIDFCRNIHADEEDPELMFQDYENYPREWYWEGGFDEETFDNIVKFAEHDNKEAVEAFMDYFGVEYLDKFEDAFMGAWSSEEAFAQEFLDSCYDLDSMLGNLAGYFNYNAFTRDLFAYDYRYCDGYVFRADF